MGTEMRISERILNAGPVSAAWATILLPIVTAAIDQTITQHPDSLWLKGLSLTVGGGVFVLLVATILSYLASLVLSDVETSE